jgi:hypothetical protein
MSAGTMKIPDPIMTPITTMVESKRPRALLGFRCASMSSRSWGEGLRVGLVGFMGSQDYEDAITFLPGTVLSLTPTPASGEKGVA